MKELEQAEDSAAHEALVEAIENQIADGHPREAGLVMMAMTAKGMEHDAVLAQMAEVLAGHVARSMDDDSGFDVNAYARDLLRLSDDQAPS